jgi:trimethylamine:corrinoid methyltransferase-like protein
MQALAGSNLIERVGPGGNFFAEEHTVQYFRESLYLSDLPNRLEFARWQEEGAKDFQKRTNEKVALDVAVTAAIESVVRRNRRENLALFEQGIEEGRRHGG